MQRKPAKFDKFSQILAAKFLQFSLSLGEAKFSSLSGNCGRAVKFELGLAVLAKTLRLVSKFAPHASLAPPKSGPNLINLAKFATKFKSVKFGREVYARIKFARH